MQYNIYLHFRPNFVSWNIVYQNKKNHWIYMTFHCSNQSFFWQPYMWCQLWLFSLRAVTNTVKWAMYGHVWQVIRLCLARICIWVDEKSVWPCWHFLLWHFSWILLLLYHEELKAMNFSLIHSLIIRLDFLADVYVLCDL